MAGKEKQKSNKSNTKTWAKGKPIPQERRDAMFDYWCEVKSLPQVEKKFGHSHTTVTKIKHDGKWEKRRKEIQVNLQKKHDKKLEQGLTSNLNDAIKLKDAVLEKLIEDDKITVNPNVRDAVLVMEYVDKLLGNMPGDHQPSGSIINVFTNMPEKERDSVIDDTETILETLRSKDRFGVVGNIPVDISSS